jgi:hypothetical protein
MSPKHRKKKARREGGANPFDQTEERFREFVDTAQPTIEGQADDLAALYARFGMEAMGVFQRSAVTEHLYAAIARDLSTRQRPDVDLLRLRRQIVLRYLADGMPLEPYYGVVQALQDAAKRFVVPIREQARWLRAISAAKDYLVVQPEVFAHRGLLVGLQNVREVAAAEATKTLRGLGYSISIVDGHASLTKSERDHIARDIDMRVRALGGIDVADRMFRTIQRTPSRAAHTLMTERWASGERRCSSLDARR